MMNHQQQQQQHHQAKASTAQLDSSESMDEAEEASDETSSNSSSAAGGSTSFGTTISESDANFQSQPTEDAVELAQFDGEVLQLPRGLCENPAIFREFFSLATWQQLAPQQRALLAQQLPNFSNLLTPAETAVELQHTIAALLGSGQGLQRFGHTPLDDVQRSLEQGNFRPDVVELHASIAKSRRREQRFRRAEHLSQLAKQLFISRERLLRGAYKSAPDGIDIQSGQRRQQSQQHLLYADGTDTRISTQQRARKRFYSDMRRITQEAGLNEGAVSDEDGDNADADAPTAEELRLDALAQQQADELSAQLSTTAADKCVYGTQFKRRQELADDDALRAEQHAKQPRLTHRNLRQRLREHKRRKLSEPTLPEFETADIRLRDVCARAQMGGNFKRLFGPRTPGRRPKIVGPTKFAEPPSLVPIEQTPLNGSESGGGAGIVYDNHNDVGSFHIFDSEGDVELQQEEVETFGGDDDEETTIPAFVIGNEVVVPQPSTPVAGGTLEESMASPAEAQPPRLEPIATTPRQTMPKQIIIASSTPLVGHGAANSDMLLQETHACFFALVRDLFCSTSQHRLRYADLRAKIEAWLRSPIAALNDWYDAPHASGDSWSALLPGAIDFLAGNSTALPDEYVPYIEHKTQLQIYQWIGAGRDSDARLIGLCSYWLQRRPGQQQGQSVLATTACPTVSGQLRRSPPELTEGATSAAAIPPSRCPSNWKVRTASAQEIADFQRQERARFEQPHRSYTYRQHGYESIVGPVKGIYTPQLPTALTKARGHSMMVGDRPNYVTILTLVRDATARLPNGEGTRAEISELLKCSQYISRDAAENVLQTIVSGALDRMHTEHDPCVRYDPKRKIWIYLHRSRSAEEFERIHQLQQQQQQQTLATVAMGAVTGVTVTPTVVGAGKQKRQSLAAAQLPRKLKVTARDMHAHADGAEAVAPSSTFSLPALVPSNPIIISNKAHQQASQTQQQLLAKCPPVPPLKYNILPASSQVATGATQAPHQQQKSLLKSSAATQQQQLSSQPRNVVRPAFAKQYASVTPTLQQQQLKATANNSTTPIMVTTPSGGLQAVHVAANSNITQTTTTSALRPAGAQLLSATMVGGKRVSLSKPIIINQIAQQQQQQVASTAGNIRATAMATKSTDGPKNIIRFVQAAQTQPKPAAGGVQLLAQRAIANNRVLQQQQLQQVKNVGNVTIIGGGNSTSASGTDGGVVHVTGVTSGGGVFKMTPQAFAALQQQQQKQQLQPQQLTIKPTAGRVLVGNTAIIAGPHGAQMGVGGYKNVVLQQPKIVTTQKMVTHASTAQSMASAATTTSTVKTQTLNVTMTPTLAKAQPTAINATQLTPQQQRVLLQNLKQQQQQQSQQQQQVQFKPVHVVAATKAPISATAPQVSASPKSGTAVHIVPQQQRSAIAQMGGNVGMAKRVSVVVSQGQVFGLGATGGRVLKTLTARSSAATATTATLNSGGRAITTTLATAASGTAGQPQIMTLEGLRQGGTLRIAAATSSGTGITQQSLNVATSAQYSGATLVAQQPTQQRQVITVGGASGAALQQRLVVTSNASNLISNNNTTITPSGGGKIVMPQMLSGGTKLLGYQQRVISNATPAGSAVGGTTMNIAQLQGKQLIFTTKTPANAISNATGGIRNVTVQQLQKQALPTAKITGAASATPSPQLQTVIMGNQILRVQQVSTSGSSGGTTMTLKTSQQQPQIVATSTSNASLPKTYVLGSTGQTIRLQTAKQTQAGAAATQTTFMTRNLITTTAASPQQQYVKPAAVNTTVTPNANRVVLAVQGGGQIFLSPQFAGGGNSSINLKSLQGMKVVSLAPAGSTITASTTAAASVAAGTSTSAAPTTPSTH